MLSKTHNSTLPTLGDLLNSSEKLKRGVVLFYVTPIVFYALAFYLDEINCKSLLLPEENK